MAQENPVPTNAPVTTQQISGDDPFNQSFLERNGSPIDLSNPWMLGALPPALLLAYLLMRTRERKAKNVYFPAMFVLHTLPDTEAAPEGTPWWERIPVFAAVTAAAFGAAGPEWNPQMSLDGDGPVLVAFDNGWASASGWEEQVDRTREILRAAYNQGVEVTFVTLAQGQDGSEIAPVTLDPKSALELLDQIQPMPWEIDRYAAIQALEQLKDNQYTKTFWLSNGVNDEYTNDFAAALKELAPLEVYEDGAAQMPYVLLPAQYESGDYKLHVNRPSGGDVETISVTAYLQDGTPIASRDMVFAQDDVEAEVVFDLDQDMDQEIFRFSLDEQETAAGTVFVDEKWKPRSVGIVVQSQSELQSLLGEARFVHKALEQHTEIYTGEIEKLLSSDDISVLVLPDAVSLSTIAREKIRVWVEEGGTLIRFAGPNLARSEHANDPLLPLNLRSGIHGNGFESALGEFEASSPLKNIVPDRDVTISGYVAVQPGLDVEEKVWARLADGSPLVTADQRGEGQVILFHTSANTALGDLALSNTFVDMLTNVIKSGKSIENTADFIRTPLPPVSVLDGYGSIQPPSSSIVNLTQGTYAAQDIGPLNPPGFYGDALNGVAYNLSGALAAVEPLGELPDGVSRTFYSAANESSDLKGIAWGGAVGFMLLSTMLLILQQHKLGRAIGRREGNDNDANGQPVHKAFRGMDNE